MLCCVWGILDGAREEIEGVNNAVFGSECGLAIIRVPVFHSVTDDIGFCGCIHRSVAYVVMEGRAYAVAIAAAEVPGPSCAGLVVYDNP